jgi:hypothetical protein
VHTGPRDLEHLPEDDDALGDAIFQKVRAASQKGLPRPAVLVIDATQVRQYDAVPLLRRGPSDQGRLLAAVGGQPDAECAAFAGTLTVRAGPRAQPARALVVYLEWPDNRWWTAWQLLDGDGQPVGDEPRVRRAVDGAPRPRGMGGWFARTRREGLRLRMEPIPRAGRQAGLDLVH